MFYIPRAKFARLSVLLLSLSLISMLGPMLIRTSSGDELNTIQEKGNSTIKIDYLGSVPLESTLVGLVPEKDKQLVGFKEKWLYYEINPRVRPLMGVSENGKFEVLITFLPDERTGGAFKNIFLDSNGVAIWNTIAGDIAYVSNNGRNIIASSTEGEGRTFYDVRTSTEPIIRVESSDKFALSYNGEYYISAGSTLALRRADGSLIWEKNTGTGLENFKAVAISGDGSYIVMASTDDPAPILTERAQTEEKQESSSENPSRATTREERRKLMEEKRSPRIEEGKSKPAGKPQRRQTKVYISFLRGDGTLITQMATSLRIAQELVISRDGKYTVFASDTTVQFYETETGTLLWQKTFPASNWWIASINLTQDGSLVAVGVRSNQSDHISPSYFYLFAKDGSEIGHFELDNSEYTPGFKWGPIACFADDDSYILVATTSSKFLFRLTQPNR